MIRTQLSPPEETQETYREDGEASSDEDSPHEDSVDDDGTASDAESNASTTSYDKDYITNINLNDMSDLIETQAARSVEILTDQASSRPITLKDLQASINSSLEALNVGTLTVDIFVI